MEKEKVVSVLFKFTDRTDAWKAFGLVETDHNNVTGWQEAKTVCIQDNDAAYAGWFARELVQRGYDFKVEASQ